MNKQQNLLKEQVLQAADDYCRQGIVQPISCQGYEDYLKKGERLSFEQDYFARRRQLAVLALSQYLAPAPATLQLLEEVIWAVCNEYSWALPAHLPITDTVFGSASPCWIDLFAAETAEALAEIKYLLEGTLSQWLQTVIDREIERRIFQPFEAQDWRWEQKENNWSAVIGGSLGIAALRQLPLNSPRQQALIRRLDTAMESYLAGFGADGACEEGVGYWAYGFGYYVYYAQLLADLLGDQRYLMTAKAAAIAAFPGKMQLAEKQFIPFSDYSPAELPTGLLSFCRQNWQAVVPAVSQISSLDFDPCYRFAHIYRNLLWTDDVLSAAKVGGNVYFPQAQWLVSRSGDEDFIFAAKGGSNLESHNQLDVGHFIVAAGPQLFLTDLGAGEYTKAYFTEATRYDFLVNNAAGHSLPVINGCQQLAGAVAAHHAVYEESGSSCQFELELTETYSKDSRLSRFLRQWQIQPQQRQVVLTDRLFFEQEENQVSERFVTQVPPQVKGRQVFLQAAATTCQLTFASDQITVATEMFKDHAGQLARAYLIQVNYAVASAAELKTVICLL